AGMRALAYDSILLGEIDEVFNANSRIRLLSYPGRKTEAFLERVSLNIILEGMGGINLNFSVPKTVDIKVGEKIVSNSPPSYMIGQVEEIRAKESEPLAEILVKIPVNLRYLRYVTLVNPP
ncbi:MAG: rod shape-determining protein MreC, partial [bacterium]|nr:rod shape-determining protein MreC [bacterium]